MASRKRKQAKTVEDDSVDAIDQLEEELEEDEDESDADEPTEADAPDGWIRVLASKQITNDAGEEEWVFDAESDGVRVARVHGIITVLVPISPEAQAEAMADASTTFKLASGKKVKVKGPQGPAARKYYSDRLEPVRGEFRADGEKRVEWTLEHLQEQLDTREPYQGRGGTRQKTVKLSKADFDKMSKEELADYLVKSGAVAVI